MPPTPTSDLRELANEAILNRLQDSVSGAAISARGLTVLTELGTARSYQRGETIVAQGEAAESFFVVLSGRVKMTRSLPTGRTIVLALFSSGDLFGVAPALGAKPCETSIEPLVQTVCLEISRDDLLERFEAEPALIPDLLPTLTGHMVECSNCVVELTSYRVEMRLARLLIKLADSVGQQQEHGVFVPIALSRQELADMVGTSIETCIRVMSRWHKEDLVETVADGFLVHDRAGLDCFAGEFADGSLFPGGEGSESASGNCFGECAGERR